MELTSRQASSWIVRVLLLSLGFLKEASCRVPTIGRSHLGWGLQRSHNFEWHQPSVQVIAQIPRGGSDEEDDYDEYDEYDEEEEEESEDEDEEVEEEEDSDTEVSEEEEDIEFSVEDVDDGTVSEYDEPLMASPMLNLYATMGVMILSRRINLFDPFVVRLARALFLGYLIVQQLFVLYVRIKAKENDDQTLVTVKNPFSSVLEKQLDGGGNAGMMKNLASSFLSSESTVKEYDLKQAKAMQSGLVMNMLFMWFLHFKMEQVQPLLVQTATGILQMCYSPLFQVYALGRNLERPFKNPAMPRLETPEAEDGEAEAEKESESAVLKDAEQDSDEDKEVELEDNEEDGDVSGESDEEDEESASDEEAGPDEDDNSENVNDEKEAATNDSNDIADCEDEQVADSEDVSEDKRVEPKTEEDGEDENDTEETEEAEADSEDESDNDSDDE